MKEKVYIFLGGIFLFVSITSFLVLKVFGSESSTYVTGCTPYNVDITKGGSENSVEITWESKQECSGYILYGSDMKDLSNVGIDLVNDISSTVHTVSISSLISTKVYFLTIVSENISYGKDGLPLQFTINSL